MPEAAAAPATVSGEPIINTSLGLRIWEDDERAVTREPGDLPSVVVTRETHRAGCPGGCQGVRGLRADRRLRGDVPQTSPEVLCRPFVHGQPTEPLCSHPAPASCPTALRFNEPLPRQRKPIWRNSQ